MKQSFYALYVIAMLVIFPHSTIFSQSDLPKDSLQILSSRFQASVMKKSERIEEKLSLETDRYLARLSKEEQRLQKKLRLKDINAAAAIFNDVEGHYQSLKTRFHEMLPILSQAYIGTIDSLTTDFKFLNKIRGSPEVNGQTVADIRHLEGLQTKLTQVNNINQTIQDRQNYLKSKLSEFGMLKDLKRIQIRVGKYQADVTHYRRILTTPGAIESKALELLQRLPAYKKFFQTHSQIGNISSSKDDSETTTGNALPGLQSRIDNQKMISRRYGSEDAVQIVKNRHRPTNEIPAIHLKSLLPGSRNEQRLDEPSGFQPVGEKSKSWKRRFVVGSNLQTVKANYFFPSTTDIGLSLGYKINDKSIVGFGGSYKLGMEKRSRHITFSHQGMGLRSFLDYKIKSGFFVTGGAELNYRSQFNNFEVLQDYSAWQKSALLGISRKQKLGGKLEANAQLSYDFLWKSQVPRTQPVVFRIGYSFH